MDFDFKHQEKVNYLSPDHVIRTKNRERMKTNVKKQKYEDRTQIRLAPFHNQSQEIYMNLFSGTKTSKCLIPLAQFYALVISWDPHTSYHTARKYLIEERLNCLSRQDSPPADKMNAGFRTTDFPSKGEVVT